MQKYSLRGYLHFFLPQSHEDQLTPGPSAMRMVQKPLKICNFNPTCNNLKAITIYQHNQSPNRHLPAPSPWAWGSSPPSCLRGKLSFIRRSLASASERSTKVTHHVLTFSTPSVTNNFCVSQVNLVLLPSGAVVLSPDCAGNEGRTRHAPGLCPGGIITAFLLKSISVFPKKASCSELQTFTI